MSAVSLQWVYSAEKQKLWRQSFFNWRHEVTKRKTERTRRISAKTINILVPVSSCSKLDNVLKFQERISFMTLAFDISSCSLLISWNFSLIRFSCKEEVDKMAQKPETMYSVSSNTAILKSVGSRWTRVLLSTSLKREKDGHLSGLKNICFALTTDWVILHQTTFKTGKLKSALRLFYVHIQKWAINSTLNCNFFIYETSLLKNC